MSLSSLEHHAYKKHPFSHFLFVIILLGTMQPLPLFSQWSTNSLANNAICTAAHDQSEVQAIGNGSDGAIFVWHDYRNGSTADIYAQCVDASGKILWKTDGIPICTAPYDQLQPQIASDGAGGAIITWQDYRPGGTSDIYAQRVNGNGIPQWTANGVAVCAAANRQHDPQIASDGSHGAIITWEDSRFLMYGDIYVQRVSAAGTCLWAADGEPIGRYGETHLVPQIISDGAGGAIIGWLNRREHVTMLDIYAQRIDPGGTMLWTADGALVCQAPNDQANFDMVSDGNGGAIFAWQDFRTNVEGCVYAQRVDKNGSARWTADGIRVCTAPGPQQFLQLTDDAAGGMIVAWADARRTVEWDIFAQRVSASGNILWTTTGVPVCMAPMDQMNTQIVHDGAGGAIVIWRDYRAWSDPRKGADIFAQRINGEGKIRWPLDGVAVCRAVGTQKMMPIVGAGTGGAIIAWTDVRNGTDTDIYAQNIDPSGNLGFPPTLIDVKDVPKDHGGMIDLSWERSALDTRPDKTIREYGINRGIPLSKAGSAFSIITNVKVKDQKKPNPGETEYFMNGASTASGEPIVWEKIKSVRAKQNERYSCDAATLSDSGAGGDAHYYFMVRAFNSPDIYWDSQPDSGCSIDNKKHDKAKLSGSTPEIAEAMEDLQANEPAAPAVFALDQNFPNPFNPTTSIRYSLPTAAHVMLEIFNATGVRVALLVAGDQEAGYKSVTFNADGYPSGMYFYRLKAGAFVETKKLIVLH